MKEKILNNNRIVVASHNKGKIAEFKFLFLPYNVEVITLSELGISDIEETGKTFEENALIKIKNTPSEMNALSDDSGLCIKALNEEPGIYSARFAKKSGGWANAMKTLYKNVAETDQKCFAATFHCSLALKLRTGEVYTFSGNIEGRITWPPRGENGFGYDPFFIPKNSKQTFAEMSHKKKILADHRFKAFKKMAKSHLIGN